jgi:DNA-directed RNA polymerase specialized sigma24 family protein
LAHKQETAAMTTTLHGEVTPGTEGGPARCVFCNTVVDVPERQEPPFDGWTVCDDCAEKAEKGARVIDRLLSILTSVEREVLTLHYGYGRSDRQCYNFDEIGERLGITPMRVAEIEKLALEKTRSFAQKLNDDDRL